MKYFPEFLKNIDRYLLLNRPLIWRTRIHFLLFFSVVVNLAVLILGFLVPVGPQSIPHREWGGTFLVVALPLLAFGGLYWAYTQHKYKLIGGNFFEKLLTIGTYVVGVAALVFNLFFFHALVSYKIANAVESEEFYEEYNYLDHNPDVESIQFAKIMIKYGYASFHDINTPADNYSLKNRLRNTLRTINEAKQFFHFDPANDDGFDALEFHLGMLYCLLLFIPMGLLMASFTGFKNILITAFAQLMLFFWSGLSMAMELSFQVSYVAMGMLLFLCIMGFFKYKIMEIGHFILLSMVPVGVLLFSADPLDEQLVLADVVVGAVLVVFTSVLLAGFSQLYTHYKAEPK